MKPSALDNEPATLEGTSTNAGTTAVPAVWKLRVVYAGGTGIATAPAQSFNGQQPLTIGRRSTTPATGAWVTVSDERVSRQHARLYRRGSELVIEDLQSRNGSAYNGTRLQPGVPQPVADGGVLRVGDSFLVLRHEPALLPDAPLPSFVGVSRGACQVRAAIARCAQSERAVLILGETGTGKEVTAQALHQLSRRPGRLVAINCAAIPETLAEAQLFGVARGAFTGAVERLGAFGEADGGTLLLDELGELPSEVQAKLLRALETREVLPVGGRHPIPRNVRIVSATNRDLAEALRKKSFRDDLYARLSAEIIALPPLRERPEDVLPLAQRFGGSDLRLSPRLVAALLGYHFPLNSREVSHITARLQDRSEEEVLRSLAAPAPAPTPAPAVASASPAVRRKPGDEVPTREQIVALLQQHHGNLSHIEAHSGYSRRQFRRWVEGHGLELASFRRGAAS